MCGRYGFRAGGPELRGALELGGSPPDFAARYNLAPTQPAPVVLREAGANVARELRWGAQMGLRADGRRRPPVFNIRSETLRGEGLWRQRLRDSRLVAPASWFYEWVGPARSRQPVLIRRADGRLLAFAGLAVRSDHEPGGRAFTIVTAPAPRDLSHLHHRWPVCLDEEGAQVWLDPETRLEALEELLLPPPAAWFTFHPVSDLVNNVANDAPEVAEPAVDYALPLPLQF
jgi:putative SOS response-associated peptidase YedK